MAYTVTVTKESVSQTSPTEFNVSVNVLIKDAADATVLEKVYSKRYTQGDTLNSVKTVLQNKFKIDVDRMSAEKQIYDLAAYQTLCDDLDTAITNYINP